MLGLALRGASALSKAGKGAQMARAITGRKKKPEPGKTKPGGDEGGGGGGTAIIKAKVVSAPASALVPVDKSPNVQQGMGSGIISILETIRANVKEIDDFYKGTVAAKREEIKKRKKQESDQRKAEQETKLEKPKIEKKPNMKGLKMPKTGIVDGIFRFISNVLMGMLVMKLIDFSDALANSGILPLLGKIGDFVLDVGGKIIDGLVTFIDKGYEIYDGLRQSIGDKFGEGAQEQFDNLAGTLNKVLNTVFSVGLALSVVAGKVGGGSAANTLGKSATRSAGTKLARNAVVKVLGKKGTKAALKFTKKFISPFIKRIPIIGGLIDFALNYFVFKEPLGRAAFAAIGSTLLGAIGTAFGGPLGMIIGGFAGDFAGKKLYDLFFKGKKPVEVEGKEEVSATGSITPYVPKSSVESDEMSLFMKLVLAEAGGEGKLGMALVARSVLNRTGLIQTGKATTGTFLADSATVKGVIMGRGQYQPVSDGSINKERSEEQLEQARIAIELAQDITKLQSMLKSEGLSDSDIGKIISATGFRTGSAFNDPSQNVNVVQYKNHFFNTAGNPGVAVAKASIAQANVDASVPAANADISTTSSGSREQTEGSKLAGELGRFLNTKGLRWGSGVTEHPEHGGVKPVHSAGSYHYKEQGYRAIDIGGWGPNRFKREGMTGADDQTKIIAGISEWNKMKGVTPIEFIHEGNDPTYHNDHVHIAYEGGGYVGGKYNMKSLERRASYEGGEQMIDIPIPMPQQSTTVPQPELVPVGSGSFSADFKDDFEFLEFQG